MKMVQCSDGPFILWRLASELWRERNDENMGNIDESTTTFFLCPCTIIDLSQLPWFDPETTTSADTGCVYYLYSFSLILTLP
jgi:hypothetical protein